MRTLRCALCAAAVVAALVGGCTSPSNDNERRQSERSGAGAVGPDTPGEPGAPSGSPAAFDVAVTGIDVQPLDNAAILGAAPAPLDNAIIDIAVEQVRTTLSDYLNAEFMDPATRFGEGPITRLLAPEAAALLDPAAWQALGRVDLDVANFATGPVSAIAAVQITGATVLSVGLDYEARFSVTTASGGAGELIQRGNAVFVPNPIGWQARAIDVTLDDTGNLIAPLSGGGA